MAESVRELIMKQVQATLESITTANGYATTLNAVERLQQGGQSHRPPMAIVIEGDDVPIDRTQQDSGGMATERDLEIGIVLEVMQDEEIDARSASEVMNELIADVQRAMDADVSRGGHALNTEEIDTGAVIVQEGKKKLLCPMAYRIRYRHLRTDPRVEV